MPLIRPISILAAALCLAALPAQAGQPRSLIGALPSIGASTATLGNVVSDSMDGTSVSVPVPPNPQTYAVPDAVVPDVMPQQQATPAQAAAQPPVSPFISRTANPQVQQLLTQAEHLFIAQRYQETAKVLADQRIVDHPHARFLTGVLNEYGLGMPRDDQKAAEYYEYAAAKGHAGAQYNLGLMYSDGRGVGRMPDRALLWIELAANQGLADAQYALGLLYYNGSGTDQDFVIALKWFEVAAGYGHSSSAENIASLAQTMKKDDVVKARQLASIWKPSIRPVPSR